MDKFDTQAEVEIRLRHIDMLLIQKYEGLLSNDVKLAVFCKKQMKEALRSNDVSVKNVILKELPAGIDCLVSQQARFVNDIRKLILENNKISIDISRLKKNIWRLESQSLN